MDEDRQLDDDAGNHEADAERTDSPVAIEQLRDDGERQESDHDETRSGPEPTKQSRMGDRGRRREPQDHHEAPSQVEIGNALADDGRQPAKIEVDSTGECGGVAGHQVGGEQQRDGRRPQQQRIGPPELRATSGDREDRAEQDEAEPDEQDEMRRTDQGLHPGLDADAPMPDEEEDEAGRRQADTGCPHGDPPEKCRSVGRVSDPESGRGDDHADDDHEVPAADHTVGGVRGFEDVTGDIADEPGRHDQTGDEQDREVAEAERPRIPVGFHTSCSRSATRTSSRGTSAADVYPGARRRKPGGGAGSSMRRRTSPVSDMAFR